MLSILLTASVVYSLFLLVHWIPFRLASVQFRTRVMTITLLACLPLSYPAFLLFSSLIPPDIDHSPLATAFFFLTVFTLLWCGYVQFFMSFDTSPSLRVLVEILKTPDGKMTEAEIIQVMDFPDTFRRRFYRAVEGRAILPNIDSPEPRYALAGKSRVIARIGHWAKDFFRLGVGG